MHSGCQESFCNVNEIFMQLCSIEPYVYWLRSLFLNIHTHFSYIQAMYALEIKGKHLMKNKKLNKN